MSKETKQKIMPGMLRNLNKQAQGQAGGGLPRRSTTTAPVQESAPVAAPEVTFSPQSLNG